MTTIELKISETTKEGCFNVERTSFADKEGLKKYLVNRYGKMPGGRKKIYQDSAKGAIQVGFTHSFWNADISHWAKDSKKWFQTDWIVFWEETIQIKHFKL